MCSLNGRKQVFAFSLQSRTTADLETLEDLEEKPLMIFGQRFCFFLLPAHLSLQFISAASCAHSWVTFPQQNVVSLTSCCLCSAHTPSDLFSCRQNVCILVDQLGVLVKLDKQEKSCFVARVGFICFLGDF